jgi:hypothetical protein
VTPRQANEYIAECFWPGVREQDHSRRARHRQRGRVSRDPQGVRCPGSLLMREHEVVLRRFEGSEAAVHGAAERAAIPFERILEVSVIVMAGGAGDVRSAPQMGTNLHEALRPRKRAFVGCPPMETSPVSVWTWGAEVPLAIWRRSHQGASANRDGCHARSRATRWNGTSNAPTTSGWR